jgi:hypothetical protein
VFEYHLTWWAASCNKFVLAVLCDIFVWQVCMGGFGLRVHCSQSSRNYRRAEVCM